MSGLLSRTLLHEVRLLRLTPCPCYGLVKLQESRQAFKGPLIELTEGAEAIGFDHRLENFGPLAEIGGMQDLIREVTGLHDRGISGMHCDLSRS